VYVVLRWVGGLDAKILQVCLLQYHHSLRLTPPAQTHRQGSFLKYPELRYFRKYRKSAA
jgi:hypothetical protein